MKKIHLLMFIMISIVLFCGCQKSYEYRFEQPIEQVEQIFIVLEENGEERRVECSDEILTDIQMLPCRKYWNDPPHMITAPYVLIIYKNGGVEEISAGSNCYEIDGKVDFDWEYFDSDEFLKVLQKYQSPNI